LSKAFIIIVSKRRNDFKNFYDIDIIYLLWHLSMRFLVCHKFSRNHEEHNKADRISRSAGKKNDSLSVENSFGFEGRSGTVMWPQPFVSLLHGIRFRSLSYVTHVTTNALFDPLLATCASSREVCLCWPI